MKHNYLNNTPLTDAQDIYFAHLLRSGFTFNTERIPSAKATDRILHQAVYALICSPHYNASAMDGIAVKASDTYANFLPTAIPIFTSSACSGKM
mgnify:CR=1 FL=1